MTDRIRTLTVILDDDYRDDDVEAIVTALRMVKGVSKLVVGEPTGIAEIIARDAVRQELRRKLFRAIDETFDGAPEP